jgi:hypothetical protein
LIDLFYTIVSVKFIKIYISYDSLFLQFDAAMDGGVYPFIKIPDFIAHNAQWPTFHLSKETAEKLQRISPAAIDRCLKQDKAALRLKGKSLTKPLHSLKTRIPIRTFYSSGERKTPGFRQINTVRHCGQAAQGRHVHTFDRRRCRLRLDRTPLPPQ